MQAFMQHARWCVNKLTSLAYSLTFISTVIGKIPIGLFFAAGSCSISKMIIYELFNHKGCLYSYVYSVLV